MLEEQGDLSMKFELSLISRLMRLRGALWWLTPAVVPSLILAIVFGFLSQLEFREEDRAEFQFGNRTSAVYLNDWLRPSSASINEDAAIQALLSGNEDSLCIQTGGLIGVPGDSSVSVGFRELSDGCEFSDFGYNLTSGSWPKSANEAVSTDGLFELGQSIAGVSPKILQVVGTVSNRNDVYGRTLLLAEGTWQSWDMASNQPLFPRLQASYTVFTNVDNPVSLRDTIANLSSQDGAAATIELQDVRDPRTTIIDRFPFLYAWIIWPVALASIAMALALRVRSLRTSAQRLVAYGLNRRNVVCAILGGAGIWIAASLPSGLLLGWGLAGLLSPVAVTVSGHAAGANPFPLELAITFYSALAIVLVVMVLYTYFALGREFKVKRGLKRRSPERGSRLKVLLGLSLAVVVTLALFQVKNVNELFGLVFTSVLTACWFMPELTALLSRMLRIQSLQTIYAVRRMTSEDSKSWIAAASATVAFGPFVAIAILLSSSVADSNANELLPPREGQALFYPSGNSEIDQAIKDVVVSSVGSDVSFVPVLSPADDLGFGLVATSEGFGAVQSIKSARDLETLLGRSLSREAQSVLESGGVIWTREGLSSEVWKSSGNRQDRFDLKDSLFEEIEPRWANDTAGFVLASTVENLGLKNSIMVWTANGLDPSDRQLIADALTNKGFDSNYIRFPREENPISLTPFQLGIGSVLGFIGATLLAVSMRSSSKQLQASSHNLIMQGVPRAWFRRVFLAEVGAPTLMGGLVGIFLAFLALLAGVQALGIALVIPFGAILSYIFMLFALFILMMSLSAFRLSRATS